MFARASKRSLPQDVYRQSIYCLEGLQLPFLCPALFTRLSRPRCSTSRAHARSKRTPDQPRGRAVDYTTFYGPSHDRNFASAATAEYLPQQDEFLPWDEPTFTDHRYQSTSHGQGIATIPELYSNLSPLIINDSLATHPKKFRVAKDGISGNTDELHQALHACLQVGRFERAAALVRRLNQIYVAGAPGLIAAHTEYVSEVTHRIVKYKDQQLLQHLQRWFQVDLRDAGVPPTATIFAMMIRASLQTLGAKKDRTVRRYINLAKEAGLGEDTQILLSLYEDTDSAADLDFHEKLDTDVAEAMDAESGSLHSTVLEPAKNIEEIRGMEQKGSGLSTLKESLSIFTKIDPSLPSSHKHVSAFDRQRTLESNTVAAAMDRWRKEDAHLKSIGVNSSLSTSSVGAMMWKWHEKLMPQIKDDIRKSQEAEMKESKSKTDQDSLDWGPYLQSLSAEKTSALTILIALRLCSSDQKDSAGLRIHSVVRSIGNGLQDESFADATRRNKKDENRRAFASAANAQPRYESLARRVRIPYTQTQNRTEWNEGMKIKLGALLLSHLMDIAKISVSRKHPETGLEIRELQPVFFHLFSFLGGKRVGVIRLNPAMLELIAKQPLGSVLAKYLPMVCEPKPWVGYLDGGFLENAVPVVRSGPGDLQTKRYAVAAARNGDMAQVYAGLDVLARTPWQINRFVFDTMLEVWNSGEALAKIPPENIPRDLPPEPPPTSGYMDRYWYMKRVREIENHRSGLKSQRCFQNFQLEVARAYLDETFYFPHNCDFRGRAYPMTPFLNHMGADNVRGLLTFAQGKELTSNGLWWLKIHLANLYGFDKASFEERLAFTEKHLPEIRDSVNNPLGENPWWLQAEDPWQCLAACKELKTALELPDPTKYVCKLPIHQDGTCNGLQHYAALGGDGAGAQQVNLVPGSRPSDIYTAVSELVKAAIAKDGEKGSQLAKALDGKVTRKVVKQTVMTNVYGVTFIGARRQVQKQLDELLTDFPNTFEVNKLQASRYIARKIFKALATMFNGAHDIQHWLTTCAARISESLDPAQVDYIERVAKGGHPPSPFKRTYLRGNYKNEITGHKAAVIWTTPLKMPVVQPYRRKTERRIATSLQNITLFDRSPADAVDKAKQCQAFPPNFIHSLDATHMFLTALKCDEVGLTFAAIHDSFWTHAGDVDTMNRIIRDAFIRMHSEDIIGRLAAEFKARYKNHMHLASVRVDTPVGQKIMAWRRERTKTLNSKEWDELLLERHRLKLLASKDPKEREQGQSMTTPGSIFSEIADEISLAPLDVKPVIIGLTTTSRDTILKANEQLNVGSMENAKPTQQGTENGSSAISEDGLEDTSTETIASEDPEDEQLQNEEDEETEASAKSKGRQRGKFVRKIRLWLPLTFPPVPKKGDFDVTTLKHSQYFFS